MLGHGQRRFGREHARGLAGAESSQPLDDTVRDLFEGLSIGAGLLLHHEERLIDRAVGLRRNDGDGLSHTIVPSVQRRQGLTAIHCGVAPGITRPRESQLTEPANVMAYAAGLAGTKASLAHVQRGTSGTFGGLRTMSGLSATADN